MSEQREGSRINAIGAVRPPLTYEETVAKRAWLIFEDISEVYAFARWMMDMWGLDDWELEFPSRFPERFTGSLQSQQTDTPV